MATYMEHTEWNQATGEAVAHSLSLLRFVFWETFCVTFVALQLAAALRWGWHMVLRRITDRARIDGETSGAALWRFFVFHTSGIVMWFALWSLMIAVTNKYYFGHPFATIAEFVAPNSLLGLGFIRMVYLFRGKTLSKQH
jgi:hypothetical protein